MSDDWGDLEGLPEPKGGVPRWLWACGCGCLVLILLGVGVTGWAFSWIKDGTDQTIQWQRVGEYLPYDEEKTWDYTLVFGQDIPFVDVQFFFFVKDSERRRRPGGSEPDATEQSEQSEQSERLDPIGDDFSDHEYVAVLFAGEDVDLESEFGREFEPIKPSIDQPAQDESDDSTAPQSESAEFETASESASEAYEEVTGRKPRFTVQGGELQKLEEITIVVQGRELRAIHATHEPESAPWGPPTESGRSMIVDLAEKGDSVGLQLLIIRQNSDEPVPVEEVQKFLAPFHVGPDR